MNKTLSVSAIQNGTVIDHIAEGQALRIIHLLDLLNKRRRITLGLNLSSKRLQFKDIIKIENHFLTSQEANEITILAKDATINVIKNFEVVEKITTRLPPSVGDVFDCPNPACITNSEMVETFFLIEEQGTNVFLVCKYCEKAFDRNQVKVKI